MYDLKKIRAQFPMLNNKTMQGKPLVFLDNASTTFKPQCVIDEMNKYYTEMTSNSHRGDYDLCYNMDLEVAKARKIIAEFVHAEENEVVFTSGDTEALNLVAYGYALKHLKAGDGILISEVEHASNALPWFRISELTGAKVYFINTTGFIKPSEVLSSLEEHPNIKLVSIASISNVLGYEVEVKEIAKIAHQHNALICIDGAQSVPHQVTDFKDLDIDFLTFSAHKMCGPTGIGALVGKYELLEKMDSFITGGGMNVTFDNTCSFEALHAPSKFEAGTLNLSAIMGFRKAVEFLSEIGMENIHKHEEEIHAYLIKKLEKVNNIIIYNKEAKSSIVAFNIEGVFAQDEATLLNSKGIAVRSGAHCAKMIHNVINTIATVRASTYLYTSKEDIDAFVDALTSGGDILDAYFN